MKIILYILLLFLSFDVYAVRIRYDPTDVNTQDAGSTVGAYILNQQPVSVIINDPFNLDGFGRLKVGIPYTIFDISHRHGKHPMYFDEKVTGTGSTTHLPNTASVQMSVGTASGDMVQQSTYRYIKYFPGKSITAVWTGNFQGGKTGVIKRMGLFDHRDGPYFRMNENTLETCIRTYISGSAVDNCTPQSSWTVDRMDGSGGDYNPSGITLQNDRQIIMWVSFQWLGSGQIQYGVNVDGDMHVVTEVNNSNVLSTAYSSSGDLPFRFEIENIAATASATTMLKTCMTAYSDGGDIEQGRTLPVYNGSEVTISTTEKAILAIRLDPNTNRAGIKPMAINYIITNSNSAVRFSVYLRPTISATWTDVGSQSITEWADAGDITSFSGGYVVDGDWVQTGGNKSGNIGTQLESDLYLGRDIDGTSDVLLITAYTLSGSGKVVTDLKFREYF